MKMLFHQSVDNDHLLLKTSQIISSKVSIKGTLFFLLNNLNVRNLGFDNSLPFIIFSLKKCYYIFFLYFDWISFIVPLANVDRSTSRKEILQPIFRTLHTIEENHTCIQVKLLKDTENDQSKEDIHINEKHYASSVPELTAHSPREGRERERKVAETIH